MMHPVLRKLFIAFIAVAVIFILGGSLVYHLQSKAQTTELPSATSVYGDFRYEVIEIEGMPCVVAAGGNYFGITCDWTKWQGE